MYRDHRRALMARLPDGLILVSAGRAVIRNRDVHYDFRQDSNFLYLTGVAEPGNFLLVDPKRGRSTLFVPKASRARRFWEGDLPGPAEAKKLFGVDRADFVEALPGAVRKSRAGYRKLYADPLAWAAARPAAGPLRNEPAKLADALDELRAVKTPRELELLREANRISGAAHREAMTSARAGMAEYEVQAILESKCRSAGLRHMAYPSIVASGTNAAVLHYVKNDARLRAGDLLLIDAGAELRGYAADVTRTFPVSTKFTRRQRDVYEIVLAAQKAIIDTALPGVTSAELHTLSLRLLAAGLQSLKLLRGTVDGLVESGAVRLFYPHGFGHLLGIDVHDGTGGRRRLLPKKQRAAARFNAVLEPGFVITAEPGIYFIKALLEDPELRRKHRSSVDFSRAGAFLGFGGIRIEDDIVVRASGAPLNLTSVPKEISDIEELRKASVGR